MNAPLDLDRELPYEVPKLNEGPGPSFDQTRYLFRISNLITVFGSLPNSNNRITSNLEQIDKASLLSRKLQNLPFLADQNPPG